MATISVIEVSTERHYYWIPCAQLRNSEQQVFNSLKELNNKSCTGKVKIIFLIRVKWLQLDKSFTCVDKTNLLSASEGYWHFWYLWTWVRKGGGHPWEPESFTQKSGARVTVRRGGNCFANKGTSLSTVGESQVLRMWWACSQEVSPGESGLRILSCQRKILLDVMQWDGAGK